MLKLKVKFDSIEFDQNKEATLKRLQHILKKAMFKMEELAVKNAPVDQGELRLKISVEPKGLSSHYVLTSRAQHSEAMEYGSEPFWADIDNLKGWARRKFGDESIAFPVQKKIAAVGVTAQPFLRPSFFQVRNYWLPLYMTEGLGPQTRLDSY